MRYSIISWNFTHLILPLILTPLMSSASSFALSSSSNTSSSTSSSSSSYVGHALEKFIFDTEQLQNVAFSSNLSRFYVAGTNKIFALDLHLNVIQQTSTGPVLDDKRCTEKFGETECSDGSHAYEAAETNNYNKILIVDQVNSHLITCGSVFQGVCQTRSLSDITDTTDRYTEGDANYFVAANDENLSTVAFVASGKSNRRVLYVAASNSKLAVRQSVPIVSSRKLSEKNMFGLSHFDGLNGGTLVKFKHGIADGFEVTYVAGFSYRGFSYFVTNQPNYVIELEQKSTAQVSKLIQICQNDTSFASYVEIQITCKSKELEYDLITSAEILEKPGYELTSRIGGSEAILVGSFSNKSERKTGLCLFPMSKVRKMFTENLKKCFSGEQKYFGLQFSNRICGRLGITIDEQYCGSQQYGPLVGTIALEGVFIMDWDNLEVTTISFTNILEHSVVFLGTNHGHIKKIHLKGGDTMSEYEDIIIDENYPITRSIIIPTDIVTTTHKNNNNNNNNTSIVFISSNKLYKLRTSECWRYSTCKKCTDAKDPHCGWCSLENKCSLKTECMESEFDNRWLSYSAWECINIPPQFVNPVQVSVKKSEQITIGVKVLPIVSPPHSYSCIFTSPPSSSSTPVISLSSPAQVSPNELRCSTPRNLNQFFTHSSQDHVKLTLSIESSQTKVKFLSTNLTVFDCTRFRSCLQCTTSEFQCVWCLSTFTCSQHDESTCIGESNLKSTSTCPQLEELSRSDNIYIPVGISSSISIPAKFLPYPKSTDVGYECLVHITTPPLLVPAKMSSPSLVVCEDHVYSYESEEEMKVVSVAVTFNNYLIDDSYALTVSFYKCELMADDCGSCLNLEETSAKLACVWCGGSCRNERNCQLAKSYVCPRPVVHEVSPSTGPIQGGTLMTIYGSNLGRKFSDVDSSIEVAMVPCDVIQSEYAVSKRIVCRTGSVESSRSGEVVLSIGEHVVKWHGLFTYQDPEIYSIQPQKGPISGGTMVTIHGNNLNTGRNILVRMQQVDCVAHFVNDSTITCETSKVDQPAVLDVEVKFDETTKMFIESPFTFTPDPSIDDIYPLSTFISGGRTITVMGTNFDSIQHPVIHLHCLHNNFSSPCTVIDDNKICCSVPPLLSLSSSHLSPLSSPSSSSPSKRHHEVCLCPVSFTMDGVESMKNLTNNFPDVLSSISVHPDPIFDTFEGRRKSYRGEALLLTGLNLNLACEASEVKVMIGNETCRVNALDVTTLYCTPPPTQPLPFNNNTKNVNNDLPFVVVSTGNLVYYLGYLEYQKPVVQNSDMWITGVAVGGGILLTIIVVILIVYRHKSSRAQRQFRKLNMQLDILESNIRNECKQAFAELQTEVSDFTSDLNAVGIPYWDYKSYVTRIVMPPCDELPPHNFTSSIGHHKISLGGHEEGLIRFKSLLTQPQFLTNFVQTLELQKSFTIRDKVKVASLLSIVFHDRLDYMSRILKILLTDLIKKSIISNHPKLMLRRTESVVEKLLSNWLSMCMYEELKGDVGRSLFMLFKAIKHQTFKGPVDVLTGEAKYSLSEDKLLREKIEPHTITTYITRTPPDVGEPTACKLLDCDTIGQAKEKIIDAIYRNAPYSCRPSVNELDLEWISSHGGRIVMRDEDSSTVVIKGWRQINTVSHYHLHDGAHVRLTSKMATYKNNYDGYKEHNGTLKNSLRTPILSRDDNPKQFHLVCQMTEVDHCSRQKVVSEIYLTRLLATKCTLQQYVDDLFRSILRVDAKQMTCVKWLFDFFDDAASSHNISDPHVVHTWKSNSLLLRFWVNVMKNPEFIFDINKPAIVDSCLSVITQTFMDSCSTHDQRLGKDSPSSKLLYAKDIPRYRHLVNEFFKEVFNLPRISDEELIDILALKSQQHQCDFPNEDALQQIYSYAVQYRIELLESLDDDSVARRLNLASQFETIQTLIDNRSAC